MFKNSRASDVHGIEAKPVKYLIDVIAPFLAYIFNLVLECGCFPSSMNLAKVTLIFKGGEKNDPNNYRHISVLPVFSKGLEKIIFFV